MSPFHAKESASESGDDSAGLVSGQKKRRKRSAGAGKRIAKKAKLVEDEEKTADADDLSDKDSDDGPLSLLPPEEEG